MSTLTDGSTTVNFSDDMTWVDEFDWNPVEQKQSRTITGALVLQESAIYAWRPITLKGEEAAGWVTRANLLLLRQLAATPGAALTLTLRGVTYSVTFDHANRAIEAKPVIDYSDIEAVDNYVVTLRLRTTA